MIEGIYWRIHYFIEATIKYIRFKKKADRFKPFYDKSDNIYRCFFKDRPDEEGPIEYVISEYIQDGLYYRYKYGWEVHHEHTFSAVLNAIMNDKTKGIYIPKEFMSDYSKQELNMIRKYITKLNSEI